ncbi:hydrolase Cof [Novosphingobium barchaimii LL02]|uniref:Hydrolase Cof n=1 Tax=Novosphingobium barchaimii LL02 TaxID=1114963 RepID=A0A0J8A6Q8_9SPHN|nr:Cof-type HAD-IIB family hydrolase [Novosphingobium barchaimii]KMS51070.1 hydrolase Cof [Novosphingobium barchaimii LL02]
MSDDRQDGAARQERSSSISVKLFISDIDGTLVRSDKSLASATVAAVKSLTEAGMPMSLISARPPSGILWIARQLGLSGPFGAFNGGTLFDRDGTVIEHRSLERDVAEAVIGLVVGAGITCWVFADGQWFSTDASDPHTEREVKSAGIEPILTADFRGRLARVDKIVGVSDDHAIIARLESEAAALAGSRATVARSQPYYLDITAAGANKGDGISRLAAAFALPLGAVAVIGDQINDLPMFARAGMSIAMGQASDAVKSRAMHITGSADEDGVAAAIARYVLPGWQGRSD